ncbi:DUF2252 family protein [Arthrobacter sp. RHLT1-20]
MMPLRMERMLENPFAFYRGTAGLMAMDLAGDPHSGIMVAACGDAHISYFGFYTSPERKLVFDLNDFDEAGAAPWDWDRRNPRRVHGTGGAQGSTTHRTGLPQRTDPYERFYMHSNINFARSLLSAEAQKVLHHAIKTARKRTGQRAVRRTTQMDDGGRLRFIERPPAMTTAPVQNTDVVRACSPNIAARSVSAICRTTNATTTCAMTVRCGR